MQFNLIVVSFSVADPEEVAPKGPPIFFFEAGPPPYLLRVWIRH